MGEGFSFYSEVRVRFSETDMYGHMNNTISFTYFEQARIDYFRHLGILMPSAGDDVQSIPIVADLQCDYVKQVFFDDVLRIYTKIAQVGNSSMDIHYLAKIKRTKFVSLVVERLCKWTLAQVKVCRSQRKKNEINSVGYSTSLAQYVTICKFIKIVGITFYVKFTNVSM